MQAEGWMMIRTVEAVVDPSGRVRLVEDVQLPGPRRLVTILDDAPRSEEIALLSEGHSQIGAGPRKRRRGLTFSRRDSTTPAPFI
jgi:hypothetical protein